MTRGRWLALVLLLPGFAGWVLASPDKPRTAMLDLPAGGGYAEKEQEDVPETVTFYGQTYEGDAFFWCLDKSGSMRIDGRIEVLKEEVIRSVRDLSRSAHFGIVAFSTNVEPFAGMPKEATGRNKSAAIAWIQSLAARGATCAGAAGVKILEISKRSNRQQKVIMFLSDGRPSCGNTGDPSAQALEAITVANYQRTPINTLLLGNDLGGMIFMRRLAEMNYGSFAHLDSN